jgi:hypothetical protein
MSDDTPLERAIRDPLERLPLAPPGLTNLGSAILTRAARPETLALIDKAIAARRRNLEEL